MTHARLGLIGPFLLTACSGLDAPRLTPPAPDPAEAGVAGYSYEPGSGAEGGRTPAPASASGRGGSWMFEAGTTGDPPSEHGAGAGGESDAPEGGTGSGRDGSGGKPTGAATGGRAGQGGAQGGAAVAGAEAQGGGAAGRGVGGRGASGGPGNVGGAGVSGGGLGAGGLSGQGGASGESSTTPRSLFVSEYVEGSGSNKALEIRALVTTSLVGCDIATYFNGNAIAVRLTLDGTVAAGDVYVLCSTSLAATLPAGTCDRSTTLSFNGNDAVALECDGATLDVIGQIAFDPGTAWSDDSGSTQDHTLRRRCDHTTGDPDGSDAFAPAVEWQGLPLDTFAGLGDPGCE